MGDQPGAAGRPAAGDAARARCSAPPPTAGRAQSCMVVADVLRAVRLRRDRAGRRLRPHGRARGAGGRAARRCSRRPRSRRCRASSSRSGCRPPPRSTGRSRTSASPRAPRSRRWCCWSAARGADLLVNAVTFALSALVLARLRFGAAPPSRDAAARPSPASRRPARGCAATGGMPGMRVVLVGLGGRALLRRHLQRRRAALRDRGPRHDRAPATRCWSPLRPRLRRRLAGRLERGAPALLKRRYLLGLLVLASASSLSGLAPGLLVALRHVRARGLRQRTAARLRAAADPGTVPDRLAARVFGVKDALTAWAFGARLPRGRRAASR